MIKRVTYYNRKDCCSSRSKGNEISLINVRGEVIKTASLKGGLVEDVDFKYEWLKK